MYIYSVNIIYNYDDDLQLDIALGPDHEGLRVGEHRHPRAGAGRHHQHHAAIPEITLKCCPTVYIQ